MEKYLCLVRTKREGGLSESQVEDSHQNSTMLVHLSLTPNLQNCENKMCILEATQSMEFCYSSLGRLTQCVYVPTYTDTHLYTQVSSGSWFNLCCINTCVSWYSEGLGVSLRTSRFALPKEQVCVLKLTDFFLLENVFLHNTRHRISEYLLIHSINLDLSGIKISSENKT